jgi:hypothetical protein
MDTVKIEMDEWPATWNRVYVNGKLMLSTDNRKHVADFVAPLILTDAANLIGKEEHNA